jgi:hypothetical protein
MRELLLVILVLMAPFAQAEIYKTVDKDGRVVYTDKPKTENAEKIELRETNIVPGAQPLPQSVPADSYVSREASTNYQIAIISPRTDVIIPIGQRDLAIVVNVNPSLAEGHLLVYFMDGELLEETSMSNIIIKDAPRGTHTLVVEAIDSSGQSLGTSPPVSVSVMRPNIKKSAP